MSIAPEILNDLKKFDWQGIISLGNQLDDLNDRQWRFIKGLVAELAVEKYSSNELIHVGERETHKDFDWPKHNLTVELKSQFSGSMYGKRGEKNKSYTVKLSNSLGTNKHENLPNDFAADLLIVVRNDGAFVLDKQTVITNSKKGGDGFEVIVGKDDITEITGKITVSTNNNLNLREKITDAIRSTIQSL